jgi:hypothetical protein
MNEAGSILKLHNKLLVQKLHSFPIKGRVAVSDKQGVYLVAP